MKTLELQIHGQNELNRVAVEIAKDLMPQLEPFLLKRVTTDKGLGAKFKEAIKINKIQPNPLPNGFASLHVCHLGESYGKLVLNISVCLNGGSYENHTYYCQYFDQRITLGTVIDNLLTSLDTDQPVHKPIEFDTEMKKIEALKKLEEQVRKLKYSIRIPESVYQNL